MNSHKHARLTYQGRQLLIERIEQIGVGDAAAQAGISVRTAYKWLSRYRSEGLSGLLDRSSRPRQLRCCTDAIQQERIQALRRQRVRMCQIAQRVGVSLASVSRVLHRSGLSRLGPLHPPEPIRRYERSQPGELLHLDTKKLGRIERVGHRITGEPRDSTPGAGWEVVHVAIDDHSRVGYVQVLADEQKHSATAFLLAAVAHYTALGVKIQRVLTDNGAAYRSKLFAQTCQALGIKHKFTRPYRPQTNGKAERFIQTLLREWAYGHSYDSSHQRTAALHPYLAFYNCQRQHYGINRQPPASRLPLNNLLQNDT